MLLWSQTAKLAYVVGRWGWRGLWEEKKQIFWPGCRSIPERLEDYHLPGRSGMQGIRCNIYHQSVEEDGGERPLPRTGYQDCVQCSWKKQKLDLDQVKRQQLGTKIETDGMQPGVHLAQAEGKETLRVHWWSWRVWYGGGCTWDTGYTIEPSGDVVGFNLLNINEAGCPPDDPNDIRTLHFTTSHRLLQYIQEWPTLAVLLPCPAFTTASISGENALSNDSLFESLLLYMIQCVRELIATALQEYFHSDGQVELLDLSNCLRLSDSSKRQAIIH